MAHGGRDPCVYTKELVNDQSEAPGGKDYRCSCGCRLAGHPGGGLGQRPRRGGSRLHYRRLRCPADVPGMVGDEGTADLAKPIKDEDGNSITKRVDQVIYTARKPLPDGYRDAVAIAGQLPANAAGKSFSFPTVQTCEKGDTAWAQIPASGQDPEELDAPAPTIAVTAAIGKSQSALASATPSDSPVAPEPTAAGPSGTGRGSQGAGLGVAGLVAGLAAGVFALVRSSRRP